MSRTMIAWIARAARCSEADVMAVLNGHCVPVKIVTAVSFALRRLGLAAAYACEGEALT
jgi:hypothetical protein